jgi:hypothetical protein
MLEKLGGFLTIVIAVAGLAMISAFQPQIFAKDRKGKTAHKVC